jgi:hypothetical protein
MSIHEAERIFRIRIKAPHGYLFAAEDKAQQLKACKENKKDIHLAFIDSFRKVVDFSIPTLKQTDYDYEEYKNDTKYHFFHSQKTLKFSLNFVGHPFLFQLCY